MGVRQAKILVGFLLLAACSTDLHTLYMRLPDADKELFDRSRQFMTDSQQERFLALPDSESRTRLIEELHIQDRLAKFPPYIQEAILGARVVPGMTPEAVLLAWGRPLQIERRDVDGVPAEAWSYQRSERGGQLMERRVMFLAGQVIEVAP